MSSLWFYRNDYSFGFIKAVIASAAALNTDSKGTVAMWQASARMAREAICMLYVLRSQWEETARRVSLLARLFFLTPVLCRVTWYRIWKSANNTICCYPIYCFAFLVKLFFFTLMAVALLKRSGDSVEFPEQPSQDRCTWLLKSACVYSRSFDRCASHLLTVRLTLAR